MSAPGAPLVAKRTARELPHLLGALLGIVAYVALHALSSPPFVYLPVERTFAWSAPQGAIAMKLFGYGAGGLVGCAVGQLVGRIGALRDAAPRLAPALRTSLAAAVLSAMVYFVAVELGGRV